MIGMGRGARRQDQASKPVFDLRQHANVWTRTQEIPKAPTTPGDTVACYGADLGQEAHNGPGADLGQEAHNGTGAQGRPQTAIKRKQAGQHSGAKKAKKKDILERAEVDLNPEAYFQVVVDKEHCANIALGCGLSTEVVMEALREDNALRKSQIITNGAETSDRTNGILTPPTDQNERVNTDPDSEGDLDTDMEEE